MKTEMKTMFFIILAALIGFSSCERNIIQSNERENERENLSDGFKITGTYRTIVHRGAIGKIEISGWKENTIATALKEKINDIFFVNSDFALNDLFVANTYPPTVDKDGIVITIGGNDRSMISTTSEPTATSIKVTGTFTGTAGTVANANMGWSWIAGETDDFGVVYATPTYWDNVVLASADTLILDWTITVGA